MISYSPGELIVKYVRTVVHWSPMKVQQRIAETTLKDLVPLPDRGAMNPTTTAGGTLIFNVFASLAEFKRSIIRERIRAGLYAARTRGRAGDRPRSFSADDLQQARALLADHC